MTSSSVDAKGFISIDCTCDGAIQSPAVEWKDAPQETWKLHALKSNWPRANQIIAADLDGDAQPGLVAGSTGSTAEVRWWRNNLPRN